MADTKISNLTAATTPLAGTEVLPIVQSGSTVKVSVANLTAGRSVDASAFTVTGQAVLATTSGDVGVGTATPSQLAANYKTVDIRGTTGGALRFGNATDSGYMYADSNELNIATATNKRLILGVNGAERLAIATDGIITMNVYGAGAATFSAAGVISSVSDETWKRKDGIPTNPDEMLKKLEPGYWYYNDEKKEIFGTDRQLGFYAQNVNQAIGEEAAPTPEKYKDKDGNNTDVSKPWGYYDRSVLAVVVMSLQKALDTIDSLTARIEALEKV
jgi:hypothetical protein